MTTNKFLTFLNGVTTLVPAIKESTGVSDSNKIVSTGDDGKIAGTLLPDIGGTPTESIITSENLAAGDFINIFDNAGVRTIRKADASNNRLAMGFVLNAVTSGNNASVYASGINNQLTGIIPGTRYFLSATNAGTVTTTSPSAINQISQMVGYGFSTTAISFSVTNIIMIAS